MLKRTKNAKGFTLIELLVVIAIITILSTLIIPTISSGREKARLAKCMSNVRALVTQAILVSQGPTGNFVGYPGSIGSMVGGDLTVKAADCPSTSTVPSGGNGSPLSGSDYTMRTGYSASAPGTDPLIYDNAGNHSGGFNVGFIAGNVDFLSSVPTPASSGSSEVTQ